MKNTFTNRPQALDLTTKAAEWAVLNTLTAPILSAPLSPLMPDVAKYEQAVDFAYNELNRDGRDCELWGEDGLVTEVINDLKNDGISDDPVVMVQRAYKVLYEQGIEGTPYDHQFLCEENEKERQHITQMAGVKNDDIRNLMAHLFATVSKIDERLSKIERNM